METSSEQQIQNHQDSLPVIVVGGGISGLYAGYILKKEGFPVKVLEAKDRYGGRIHSLNEFAGYPLELGAEFMHGKYSLFYEFLEYLDIVPTLRKGKNYLYFKETLISEKKAEKAALFDEFFDFLEDYWKYKGKEQTVTSYLSKKQFEDSFRELLEVFAVEFGTSNERLGMKSLAAIERRWSSGKGDYKVDVALHSTLQHFSDVLQDDLILNAPVNKIEYTEGQATVFTETQVYPASKVLVTVPLTMLKEGVPHFSPALPEEKQKAISTLGMDKGMKVFLKFKERFWKKKMFELYGSKNCPLYYTPYKNKKNHQNILIGYVTGKKAENLAKSRNSLIDILVKELDVIFGNKVASENLVDSFVMDWGEEPYIKGMYSYDPPFSEGMREILAAAINNIVFFAGEATQYNGHSATVQGAMESAERAVTEIMEL